MTDRILHFALTRCASDASFVAHWLVRYQLARTLLDEQAVASALGLSLESLAKLAMCRVPRHAADLERVAEYCGTTAAVVEEMFRVAGFKL